MRPYEYEPIPERVFNRTRNQNIATGLIEAGLGVTATVLYEMSLSDTAPAPDVVSFLHKQSPIALGLTFIAHGVKYAAQQYLKR